MRLSLTFCIRTDHYPSTFDEDEMIETIAQLMGVYTDDVDYYIDEVEE